jgi:general secretion pathway protein F
MALFQYAAVDLAGKESKGTVQADSEKLARHKLRIDGLIPVELIPISRQSLVSNVKLKNIDKRIPSADLALFTRELCALISAGLEIEQSVAAVASQTNNKHLHQILLATHSRILEGYSLSSGLNEFPKAFPQVYRATIKSGEDAGQLAKVLDHLADYLDSQEQMRQKIIQAIIYPSILTVISVGIVIFLLTYVTPKIISIFEDSNAKLPMATKILLGASHFFQSYGLILLVAIVVLIFIWKRLLKIPSIKEKYDIFMLRLPIVGKTIQLIETARFLRTLAILTEATVPILQAFTVACDLVNSIPIRKEILQARDRIKEGSTISLALKHSHYFTASSLQFIASGENSGKLEEMLMRSSLNQERHVQYSVGTLLTAFEPLLILLMGAMVLFIVLATLLPIFQLTNMIS